MFKSFAIVLFCLLAFPKQSIASSNDTLKAKILILSNFGDSLSVLKNYDRVFANDGFRVLIQTFTNCYAYVVYSDADTANLLFRQSDMQKTETFLVDVSSPLILPTPEHFYVLDDVNAKVKISIILSSNRLKSIEAIFDKTDKVTKVLWDKIEKTINEEQKNINENNTLKPFSIAGNVSSTNEEYLNRQSVLVGQKIISRIFNLQIIETQK